MKPKRGYVRLTIVVPRLVADHIRNRAKRWGFTTGQVVTEYTLLRKRP